MSQNNNLIYLDDAFKLSTDKTNRFPTYFSGALDNAGLSFINGYSHYHLMVDLDVSFFTPVYNCSNSWFLSKLSILKLSEFEKFQELFPDALSLNNLKNKDTLLKNKYVPSLVFEDKIPLSEVKPEFIYRGIFGITNFGLLEDVLSSDKGVVFADKFKPHILIDSYVSFDKKLYFSKVKS